MADITNLPDPKEQLALMVDLSWERREKIERLQTAKSRRQSLGAGLLLGYVFDVFGIPRDSLQLNTNGKPEADGLFFNISHSENMVICAVGEKTLGCDIEQIRRAPEGVAKRFFCDSERTYLQMFKGDAYDREFFRIWTMKESYVKMTGEGLSLPLDTFALSFSDEVRVFRNGLVQDCRIQEYAVDGYLIAVCAQEQEFEEQIELFDLSKII